MQEEKKTQAEKREKTFSKSQLMKAKTFSEKKDIISALFSETKNYTAKEAEEIITNYLKGQVK